MATPMLNDHAATYIDPVINMVDISQCVVGQHTRSVKPSGIAQLKNAIMELGYVQVHTP
jgi:hypothetical protein